MSSQNDTQAIPEGFDLPCPDKFRTWLSGRLKALSISPHALGRMTGLSTNSAPQFLKGAGDITLGSARKIERALADVSAERGGAGNE